MISPQARPIKTRSSRFAPQQKFCKELKVETTIKLIFSWILILGAIASLAKLLPYNFAEKTKLKELRAEVQETEARVAALREQLNYNFDPEQTQSLMEQYSSQLAPNQSRIFWKQN